MHVSRDSHWDIGPIGSMSACNVPPQKPGVKGQTTAENWDTNCSYRLVCVCVFAGCQTRGAPGKGCDCTIGRHALTHARARRIFAASGGICVANVITAVQLQDDRIKLLLKRESGEGEAGRGKEGGRWEGLGEGRVDDKKDISDTVVWRRRYESGSLAGRHRRNCTRGHKETPRLDVKKRRRDESDGERDGAAERRREKI